MTWPWTSERCQFLILFQPLFLPPPSLFTQTIWLWTATYNWMRETATMPKNCPVVTSGDFGFCFLRFSQIVAIISWRDTSASTSWDINMWEAGDVHKTYQWSGLHLLILCRPGKQPGGRLKKEVQLCQPHLWPDDKKWQQSVLRPIHTDLHLTCYFEFNWGAHKIPK